MMKPISKVFIFSLLMLSLVLFISLAKAGPDSPTNNITIINVQSYPALYGNWTVRFNTTGTANLTIRAVDGTEFGGDLQFLELKCGETVREYQWSDNSAFIEDYECNDLSYETSRVLTPGKHYLEFDFGGQKVYAKNDADAFETGIVNTNGWTTVNTVRTYTIPIVVAGPVEGYETSADLEVATAVIRNIASSSFEVQLYNETNGALAGNVSYIVVENGSHTLSNGMLLQAGRYSPVDYYDANSDSPSSYYSISFWTAYASAPSVIASPNNDSAQDWVAVRYDVGTLTTTGINISLEIDQLYGSAPIAASLVGSGENNSIAWIAMNATSATDMEAALEPIVDESPDTADWRALTFSNTYTVPLFFGLGEEDTGTDPCTVGRRNLAASGVDIRRTEERTDNEQQHAIEDTLWMVFESGLGNSPPTTPTNITCDGGECNITVDITVELNASGSTDANGDNITYYIEASLLNTTTSDDQESGEKQAIATGGGTTIGETGNVTASDSLVWTWVSYQGSYSSTPVVIATPVTTANCAGTCSGTSVGNGGYYPIPLVKDVSTTGFNFSMCVDGGNVACTTSASSETFDYFVFDVDAVSSLSWIDAGNLTVTTAGADTPLTYGKTFANVPVIWTTPQTYSQNGNIAAIVWAEDTATKSTTSAPLIGCVHQGTGDSCTSGQPSENVGYVAIDTNNVDINTFQTGSATISDSAWTAATFSPTYTNPRVMVTQNDDNGAQDPQYPWARSVTGSGMDFRYCEEDAGDECNTHTGEVVNWFTIEQGDIALSGGTDDIEATKDWETYNDIISSNWKNITGLNVTVNVSVYNKSGSTQNGNNDSDLQLEVYNGSKFLEVGNFSVNGLGNFTLTVSDSTILAGWQTMANTDLRIRGVNFDYADSSNIDEINWTDVWVTINGTRWIEVGNHTNTTTLDWNTSDIAEQTCIDLRTRAIDPDGTNTYSGYFTKGACLNISHPPKWRNQGQNTSTPNARDWVRLYAQGKDNLGVAWALLETNESGVWENKTGVYGSPMNVYSLANTWNWSNFTWRNTSLPVGTQVSWRIWYNDTSGNWNVTDYMNFTVVRRPTAMIAYGEASQGRPRYRYWFGDTGIWGGEQEASDVGGIPGYVVLKAASTRDEYVLGTLDDVADINVQVYNGTARTWGTATEITANSGSSAQRGFDIAHEQVAGDAIVVYADNAADPLYRVWNGSDWGSPSTLNLPTTGVPYWIRMASKPDSDEIVLVALDANSDVAAAVWNGTGWTNTTTLETSAAYSTREGIAVTYEYGSGRAMVAWTVAGQFEYTFWEGTAWNGTIYSSFTWETPNWLELGPDPSSSNIVQGELDGFGPEVEVNVWNDSAWGTYNEIELEAEESDRRCFDVAFERSGDQALVAWADKDVNTVDYMTWNSSDGWSSESSTLDVGGDQKVIALYPDPNSDEIFMALVNNLSELHVARWNGSGWESSSTVLEDDIPGPLPYETFMLAYKEFAPTWESYNDSAHNNQDDLFDSEGDVVYMLGKGYTPSKTYKVRFYDGNNDTRQLTYPTANSTGYLEDFHDFGGSDAAGTWHVVVYPADYDNAPTTYDPDDWHIIADDSFEVAPVAIPEFPASVIPLVLSAMFYIALRGRYYGKD